MTKRNDAAKQGRGTGALLERQAAIAAA